MANIGREKGGVTVDDPIVEHPDDPLEAALNREAHDAIGLQLRKVYGEMLNAPIPEKFSELLASLARGESESKG